MNIEWDKVLEYLIFPFLITGGGLILKIMSRRYKTGDKIVSNDDKFIGIELGVTACLTLFLGFLKRVHEIDKQKIVITDHTKTYIIPVVILVLLIIIIFIACYFIGRLGWKETSLTESHNQKGTTTLVQVDIKKFELNEKLVWITNLGGFIYLVIANLLISSL